MTDWGAVYVSNIDAVTGLAEGLSADAWSAPVPATPAWTVRQVVAHLAGSPADAISGRMDGAPGHTWTQRHVDERAGLSDADLIADLRSSMDAVVASLEGNDRPALVWNAAVHHADLHEALGKGVPPAVMWQPIADALAPTLGDHAPAFADVDDYELFRMLFSRRSRAQVAGWGTGLDQDTLDGLAIFGPRDDDQPVPAT